MTKQILISGASIGGPALAYWLDRYGYETTIVERAPHLRPGGQAVDVRGPALEVVARMGLLDEIRAQSTEMRGMTVVDETGNELFSSTEHTLTGGDLASPDVEIMRDDLSELLYRNTTAEYLFNDTITKLNDTGEGLRVEFENRAPRAFDLVIGADGLHSNVRNLVFGPEQQFIRHLGTYLSVFTTPNFLNLDHWQVFCQAGEVGGGVMSARKNTEARCYLGFEAKEPITYDYRDTEAQRALIAERFANAGWEFQRALEFMGNAPDFHFDSMSQVHMPTWSSGRVTLLGDAGYCGSPLSGQGTSMALVGAYVLAGELKTHDDHKTAFARYEAELRDYVRANQQLALDNRERVEKQDMSGFTETVNSLVLKDYGAMS